MDNKIGERIRSLRVQAGITQSKLAQIINISNSTLSQYESGKRIPSDDVKVKIANLFNVTVDYIIGNSDIKNPYKANNFNNFSKPDDALELLLNQDIIMNYCNFNISELSNDDKSKITNELMKYIEFLGYKYKK